MLVPSLQLLVHRDKSVTMIWNNIPQMLKSNNHPLPLQCLSFRLDLCQRVGVYRTKRIDKLLLGGRRDSNRTRASPGMMKLYKNDTTIRSSKLSRPHYKNISCRTQTSRKLQFDVGVLRHDVNYSYVVRIRVGDKSVGRFTAGVFAVNTVLEETRVRMGGGETVMLNGVVVYGISCGVLLLLLFFSFVLAWLCKWQKLMSDVAVKRSNRKYNKGTWSKDHSLTSVGSVVRSSGKRVTLSAS